MRHLLTIVFVCVAAIVRADDSVIRPGAPDVTEKMRSLADKEAELKTIQDEVFRLRNELGVGESRLQIEVKMIELSYAALREKGVEITGKSALQAFLPPNTDLGAEAIPVMATDSESALLKQIESWIADPAKPAKVIADPTLSLPFGKRTWIRSGGELPVALPGALGATSIEYRFYGTQLDVMGTMKDDGTIDLEVQPRCSEIDPSRGVSINRQFVPAFRVRECNVGVHIRPPQKVVICGLVQSRTRTTKPGGQRQKSVNLTDEVELVMVIQAEVARPQVDSPTAEAGTTRRSTIPPSR